MKSDRKILPFIMCLLLSSLLFVSCGPGQLLGPTLTPTPTMTATPTITPTPAPTATATPMPTPTAIPGIGIDRETLQTVFEELGISLEFHETDEVNGQPAVEGISNDLNHSLILIGRPEDLTSVILESKFSITAISHWSVYFVKLMSNVFPDDWQEVTDWYSDNRKIIMAGEGASIIIDNKHVRMNYDTTDLVMICIISP